MFAGQAQGVIIIAMVSLLSTDLNPKYENVQVCDKGTGAEDEIEPRDYTGERRVYFRTSIPVYIKRSTGIPCAESVFEPCKKITPDK